ncbi:MULTISPECIES: hypothetical protein [Streptomyces]|uniref:Uncharacterized protein n=1 Tax=Streptomyces spinosisporus TaxID=2927582 RepID=A0ABS9X880_9ACTN|nr:MULTISPECIES: hypothetical protein [Streptomyces]EPD66072.1 hypothetical protein HMPREF1211_02093 [Streptomyces sp. HGB0020]MCI3238277.1 hypothetical protein [Streptomyces spinosisporus]WUB35313.1 hypothetical protein OHN38_10480 [Streptomyces sp. NBC_00588]
MNDRVTPAMHATPDGEAEISLVVKLPWEDVARLGQEAGRLAAQMQRPVTLDEAVSHRLRSVRSASHAKPAGEQPAAVAAAPSASSASVSSLPPRPPAEQARQAIERINGSA